jgi:hypothetical protein
MKMEKNTQIQRKYEELTHQCQISSKHHQDQMQQ